MSEASNEISEIKRVLIEMDTEAFMKRTSCGSLKLAIIAMHKCRVNTTLVSRKLRRESSRWLTHNGYKDYIRPVTKR